MDYSCGLGPHLGGSLRRGTNIRRSISSSKYIGGIDWHLRTQFLEQAKCLELKLDIDCTVLTELQDFYRRRAVVEQDYADALAKLANGVKQRHINETSKRPHWTQYTTTTIWNTLLGSTLRVSEAHATLSDLFSKQMVQRLIDMDEDATRLHKQCREMMSACQNRVLADTTKLQADHREYSTRQAATLEAERARRRAEEKLLAAENKARSKGKDPTTSQRYQRAQNEYASKQMSYMSTTMATARARNEYLIQLAATNHSVARYFAEEAPDIIDCLACGFHNSLARSAMMHLSCEEALKTCHSSIVEMLNRNITALDWRQDKSLFLKRNEQSFSRPGAFLFVPSKEDNESHIRADGVLREGLEKVANQLVSEIDKLRISTEETWKSLEEVEKKLLDLINQKDYDVSRLFITERPRRRRSLNTSLVSNGTSNSGTTSNQTATIMAINSASPGQSVIPPGSTSTGRCHSPSLSSQSSNLNVSTEQVNTVSSRSHQSSSGSQVLPSGSEEQSTGLYLSLRAAYRDSRIAQEKAYLDGFASYTQEMHQCQVLQVKLSEIRHALSISPSNLPSTPPQAASIVPSSGSHSALRCGVPVLPRPTVSNTKSHSESPQAHSADSTPDRSLRADDLSLSPLPPPPVPHSRLLTSGGSVRLMNAPNPYTNGSLSIDSGTSSLVHKPQPRRVLRVPNVGKPKLFGGTIDEYVEATKQEIPCILLSCTRVIVQFGMHQQGIFRVSGSQTEIAEFKAAFERGEDPLVDVCEARDINSTAGLFKLYFRELGEPPFPNTLFLSLVDCAQNRSDVDDMARRLRQVVIQGLSRPVFIVMRFLFAFLNHVAEHADENMMDAYNLAICFGPSLLPVPNELNQVQYQASVIDLVKTFITHHVVIFDPMVPGPVYVKHTIPSGSRHEPTTTPVHVATSQSSSYSSDLNHNENALKLTCMNRMAFEVAETAMRRKQSLGTRKVHERNSTNAGAKSSSVGDLLDVDQPMDQTMSLDEATVPTKEGDNSGDELKSISDSESSETPYTLAIAQADFTGSTPRELSFQQGDELFLYRRLNDHWWEGQLSSDVKGTRGLVPHLYVIPKVALACLVGLGSDTAGMDQSQYDGIGEEDEDEEEDEEESKAGTKDILDDTNLCKKPAAMEFIHSDSNKPSELSDKALTIDQNNALKPLGEQSPPVKTMQMDGSELETWVSQLPPPTTDTHSSVLTVSPPITQHSLPESTVQRSLTDNDTKVQSAQSESAPSSPSVAVPQSHVGAPASVILRKLKSPGNSSFVEPTRPVQLRHTASYPLSGGLVAVPEDEAVSGVDYCSSPAHRQSSSGESEPHGRFTFASDIDTALAEVMRGLSSLEEADNQESNFRTLERTRELSRKLQLPCAKHAPDLVMDLPVQTSLQSECSQPTPLSASAKTGPILLPDGSKSSADNFAEQGMDTMRKRPEVSSLITRMPAFSRREGLDMKAHLREEKVNSDNPAVSKDSDDTILDKVEEEPRTISIASRVAALEANRGNMSSTRSVPRPPLAPKPKRT